MFEDEKNNVNGNSGSDSGGSIGTSDGSADGSIGSGSVGSANGSGGSANGSGGNDSGNVDRSADSGNGNASADVSNTKSPNGTVDGNSDATRGSRADRVRRAGSVRLGSADGNSTATGNASGSDAGRPEELDSGEPVIRLGAKKQGRPRATSETKSDTSELKLSEMKDIISMFLDTAFEIPAVMMRQDFWRLNKEENKALTDAVSSYIKSMPKAKSSWLMNFIQDNLPLVNLIMVGFFVVSERVKSSVAIAQVTKAGNRFATATATEAPMSNNDIRTPLDNMFS